MTYAILLAIVVVFVILIRNFGESLLDNDKANISNDTIKYISDLSGDGKTLGINTSFIDTDLEDPVLNESGDNKNEFALDFNFGKKKSNSISTTGKRKRKSGNNWLKI